MQSMEAQDAIFQLFLLSVDILPGDFPLYPYVEETLGILINQAVSCESTIISTYFSTAEHSDSLITFCSEVLLSKDPPLPLLQSAAHVLLLAFEKATKQSISRAIVSLVDAALNRKLEIAATRLVLSIFRSVINKNMHATLLIFTNSEQQDEFVFEVIHLCVLSKLALTDSNLNIGLVIYTEDLQASGIRADTLLFFTIFLILQTLSNSELVRSSFYVSLLDKLPKWIPKTFLEGFDFTSTLQLIQETLSNLNDRFTELTEFVAREERLSTEFISVLTSITCACKESYKILRQTAVTSIILLMEMYEKFRNFTSPVCIALVHAFHCMVLLPLLPETVIFINLECTAIPRAAGHLVLSEAYGGIPEDAKAELKKQRDACVKAMGLVSNASSAKSGRPSRITIERASFCLWAFTRVFTGTSARIYPLHLMQYTYLSTSPLLLYVVVDTIMGLAKSDVSTVSSLALRCLIRMRMHCLDNIVHSITEDSDSGTHTVNDDSRIPSLTSVQRQILENMSFLGVARSINRDIVNATRGKAIREAKPDVVLDTIADNLTADSRAAFDDNPSSILSLLTGIVHPSVPFLLLFSKKRVSQSQSQSQSSEDDTVVSFEEMSECEKYFYLVLKSFAVYPGMEGMDELDLFRHCCSNFLLSGEGQEIERAMIACANAVAFFISELPYAYRSTFIDYAPALRILLGSIVVLTTECLSEKIPLASKMSESKFISILLSSPQIKAYMSSNYQLSEASTECHALLYNDLSKKFASIYRRTKSAPLAVDRSLYDTVVLKRGVFLPTSLCLQLDNRRHSTLSTPYFCSIFEEGCTASSMLPGTIDSLLSMSVRQTIMHRNNQGPLRAILAHHRGTGSDTDKSPSPSHSSRLLRSSDNLFGSTDGICGVMDSPLCLYMQMYLLLQSSMTQLVASVLEDASNGNTLTPSFLVNIYKMSAALDAHVLKHAQMLAKYSGIKLVSGLLEREFISASYLTRYFTDMCQYTQLSEYANLTSANAWIGLNTMMQEHTVSHIYAGLGANSLSVLINLSAHGSERWRTKSMNDVVLHAVQSIITRHAINGMHLYPFDIDFRYHLFPGLDADVRSLSHISRFQSIFESFSCAEEILANKLLMCPAEICKQIVSAYEANADYSLIIHRDMIGLVVRQATVTGLDTHESSLMQHTTKVNIVYMILMILGALEYSINAASYANVQSIRVCLPDIFMLVELAISTTQKHVKAINAALHPIDAKLLTAGQGAFSLSISVEILSFCLYLVVFNRFVTDLRDSGGIGHSDLTLIFQQLKERESLMVTPIPFLSTTLIDTMATVYTKLSTLSVTASPVLSASTDLTGNPGNPGAQSSSMSLLYSTLCLNMLHRHASTNVFWTTVFTCMQDALNCATQASNLLSQTILSPIREFNPQKFFVFASQLLQLFTGEGVSPKLFTTNRSITTTINGKGTIVTLPLLTAFFFGEIPSSEKPGEKVEEGSRSLFSIVTSAFWTKNPRTADTMDMKGSISQKALENFAELLTTISTSAALESPIINFLLELGSDCYAALTAKTVDPCEMLGLCFAVALYYYIVSVCELSPTSYLSLPFHQLDSTANAASAAASQAAALQSTVALPLLLPLSLVARTLAGTKGQHTINAAVKTLAFLGKSMSTTDEMRLFTIQHVYLPLVLLARSSVPLTALEKTLAKSPDTVSQIYTAISEVHAAVTNTETVRAIEEQVGVLRCL